MGSCRCCSPVADAAHRLDELAVIAELVAEIPDMDLHDVGSGIEARVPDLLEELRAAHRSSGVLHEIREERELARGEIDVLAVDGDLARGDVDRERTETQRGGRTGAPAE